MSKRYYISKIVGTGDEFDPFRPKIADYGVAWVGSIESDPVTGRPIHPDCVVLVATANHAMLKGDPDIDAMPNFPLDGKLSAITNATKTAMYDALTARGFDTSGLVNTDGYRDVLQKIGLQRSPAFDIDNFDVVE